jgi:hypothetical protein
LFWFESGRDAGEPWVTISAINYIAAGVILWCSVFSRWPMPGPEET